MNARFGKALLCLSAALFLLLLLSALVEGPALAPAKAPSPRFPLQAALPSAWVLPGPEKIAGDSTPGPQGLRPAPEALACRGPLLVALKGRQDANGRVLTEKCYVDSVYPIFHPQAASG